MSKIYINYTGNRIEFNEGTLRSGITKSCSISTSNFTDTEVREIRAALINSKIKGKHAYICISTPRIAVRIQSYPATKQKLLEKLIAESSEEYLAAINTDDYIIRHRIMGISISPDGDRQYEVALIAVPKYPIASMLDLMNRLKLKIDKIDALPNVMQNSAVSAEIQDDIVVVGGTNTSHILMFNKGVLSTYAEAPFDCSSNSGINQIQEEIRSYAAYYASRNKGINPSAIKMAGEFDTESIADMSTWGVESLDIQTQSIGNSNILIQGLMQSSKFIRG